MKLSKIFNRKGKEVFKCECCGTEYDDMPLCFGSEFPDYYYSIPPDERKSRIEIEKSLCVVDEEHFFHRGRLTIPILDYPEDLYFDIWASISRENFEKRMDDWNNPQRIENEPYFGWLQNQIPTYKNTLNIKSRAIEQNVDSIVEIEIGEENHQLTFDQENGITLEKAKKIVQFVLKDKHKNE
ncbi:DUF2199 domain-containing protein [Aquimarina sp. 2304DJ70-9]|uniref:DUF2199 domain-containing protein n=1 Tax=Aquimarina penaris TaxID=3231044 RepID=UPI0034634F13